jgi:hypothetical protein
LAPTSKWRLMSQRRKVANFPRSHIRRRKVGSTFWKLILARLNMLFNPIYVTYHISKLTLNHSLVSFQ